MAHPISLDQAAIYALKAGWRGNDAVVAVAVAAAESGNMNPLHFGLDADAHATHGEDSRGLWQINVRAHPEYATRNLYDPQTNANTAHEIWARSGWGPWSTHNSGAYIPLMPLALAAVGVAQNAPGLVEAGTSVNETTQGAVDSTVNAAKTAADAANSAVGFLADLEDPKVWTRVGKVVIGGALIVAAMAIFARPVLEPAAKTTMQLVKTAGNVAAVGAVAA